MFFFFLLLWNSTLQLEFQVHNIFGLVGVR